MHLVNYPNLPPLTEAENAIARMYGILLSAHILKPSEDVLYWPLGGLNLGVSLQRRSRIDR